MLKIRKNNIEKQQQQQTLVVYSMMITFLPEVTVYRRCNNAPRLQLSMPVIHIFGIISTSMVWFTPCKLKSKGNDSPFESLEGI